MSSKRLLLVTHHPLDGAGGAAARWRSLARHLPDAGWEFDIASDPLRLSPAAYSESKEDRRRVERRARFWSRIARLTTPPFTLLGIQRAAMPLMAPWLVARGAISLRRRLREGSYDAVVATGPPMLALLVARAASTGGLPPLVVELRDLWAGNPTYDRRGGLLGALEGWIFGKASAVIACTPQAAQDLGRRHPAVVGRICEIPNGFEPELMTRRAAEPRTPSMPITILHSGTLAPSRPVAPLLEVLAREPYRSAFRLVHHGYASRESLEEMSRFQGRCDMEILPPSGWAEAVERMGDADVGLILQTDACGDPTAVAAKVYELLALGKPVLCLTNGGATESLLSRLGADRLCGRIDDESSIVSVLDRLLAGPLPSPVPEPMLHAYDRSEIAAAMARLLDRVSSA
jgi:glycosyltransferase involved in cell wall biosynthesis